jgi:Arc/MetJ-type ribon-helix-helix transcriptional regulator
VVFIILVTVHLPEAYLEGLEQLVKSKIYPNRSEAIRVAVRDLLKRELWERQLFFRGAGH